MKSINTWNLTNNKLHQLFKDNNEFISIKVRGNTWEPITRWLRLDSRVFIFVTSKLVPLFIMCLTFTYYFFLKNISNFNFKENTFLIIGLLFFGLSWSLINLKN